MQGRDDGQRQFLDVESLAGHLLPEGSVFGFLAGHRHVLFPDDAFADLFPSGRGRPSIPADVIASVMVLQTIHNLSDRETADAVTFDLRWKAACGFAVTETSFHPSVLTYWRRRLAASECPHRIFDAVAEVIAQTGVLARKRRRAIDSTILDDAVVRQDTVTQLIAQIRRVARQVPAAAQFIAGLSGHDYSKPGKPDIAWDDPAARDLLVTALVNDALAVLAHLEGAELSDAQSEVVALLALVAGQDVEPAEGTDGTDGRWRIARKVAPDRVISTVDPEARHAHKSREKKQDGFKATSLSSPTPAWSPLPRSRKPPEPKIATRPVEPSCWPPIPASMNRSRCWPIRPMVRERCSLRSRRQGIGRLSNRCRSTVLFAMVSPSMISMSITTDARLRARLAWSGRSVRRGKWLLVLSARPAR